MAEVSINHSTCAIAFRLLAACLPRGDAAQGRVEHERHKEPHGASKASCSRIQDNLPSGGAARVKPKPTQQKGLKRERRPRAR
jgi:hypothetical protein